MIKGMCDRQCCILQSQAVGDHTSVHLRRLVECLTKNAPLPDIQPITCPCDPPSTSRQDTTITSTDYLLNRVNCQKLYYTNIDGVGPPCERKSKALELIHAVSGSRAVFSAPHHLTRTPTRQPKIEWLCRPVGRPAASTYTARLRSEAASVKVYAAHEKAPVPLPPCPLPAAPQPGVPLARNLPCGVNLRID